MGHKRQCYDGDPNRIGWCVHVELENDKTDVLDYSWEREPGEGGGGGRGGEGIEVLARRGRYTIPCEQDGPVVPWRHLQIVSAF